MKLKYKIMEGQLKRAFLARRELVPCLENTWHFHEEYELIYFIKSKGIRYIGNTIGNFEDGEIYLAGPNIPHLYKNEITPKTNGEEMPSVDQIIIHFRADFMGAGFLNLPESAMLCNLMKKTQYVLRFSKVTASLLHNYLIGIAYKEGLSRITDLLRVLDVLSISKDYEMICHGEPIISYSKNDKDRMSKIIHYLNDNYSRKIELGEISDIAHMTPNAFCRFFKKNTNKSFSDYLNELRIGSACKMLIEGDKSISAISGSSGFNSISNFNRRFKRIMGITPGTYKRKYTKETEFFE
jgi:AraC-like DNA-binding protein